MFAIDLLCLLRLAFLDGFIIHLFISERSLKLGNQRKAAK
jgi:hypothetical protein